MKVTVRNIVHRHPLEGGTLEVHRHRLEIVIRYSEHGGVGPETYVENAGLHDPHGVDGNSCLLMGFTKSRIDSALPLLERSPRDTPGAPGMRPLCPELKEHTERWVHNQESCRTKTPPIPGAVRSLHPRIPWISQMLRR
jgi:hypothetical protein